VDDIVGSIRAAVPACPESVLNLLSGVLTLALLATALEERGTNSEATDEYDSDEVPSLCSVDSEYDSECGFY
jgi:hypothetical protein